MTIKKRAQNEQDKQAREAAIIAIAQELLLQKGFNNINVNDIAQSAGLAKGTLYLYFKSKEELFLSVFELQINEWFRTTEAFLQNTPPPIGNEGIAQWLTQSFVQRPHLTRLIAISSLLLEQNVTYERAKQHKLWMYGQLGVIGACLAPHLQVSSDGVEVFMLRVYAFVAGLECIAHPAPISLEVYAQDPTLIKPDFAQNLYELILLQLTHLRQFPHT